MMAQTQPSAEASGSPPEEKSTAAAPEVGDAPQQQENNETVHARDSGGGSPPESDAGSGAAQQRATAESETRAAADQQLAELAAALELAKDAELRARAELENFRKRVRREQEEQLRYANWNLLRDLLEVLDNLTRAVEAAEKPQADLPSLLQGVRIVADQLQAVLAKYHCQKIPAKGQPFDPELHTAIGQLPTAEQPPGTIAQVTREGYRLHDRLLRPAEVVVTTAPAAPAATEPPAAAPTTSSSQEA
jgi:molecular chaperone GrpE